MLEAARNPEILPVPVKTTEQQAIQGLHRCRSAWMETRTARINTLRGLLREFGLILPVGAATALQRIPEMLTDQIVPSMLRPSLQAPLDEIRELKYPASTSTAKRSISLCLNRVRRHYQHDPSVSANSDWARR